MTDKPKGGRGIRATKPTTHRRVPEGITTAVDFLSAKFRADEWDGSIDGLKNLLTGFDGNTKNTIREILDKSKKGETGYTTKSFSRGLKRLKRLIER